MAFKCDNCGEVDHVLVDGYNWGDTLLEGVMFEVLQDAAGSHAPA